ncbi:MAG: UDP-N-acetylglucosamine diphosphorylase/glucosamine-1-phosphate N-acetyltransferase [Epulopiscium sp. Nele67-Bin005]|nr:MAG: UDP-N-acetylglucosamine diphosphorylase/glucosamine-1-phosphate N-acetyltransferase [Epulopiscium sp. Nele67-Bin005]
MKIKAVILAAGQGTRMKSEKPKVLHEILGEPMVTYPINAAKSVGVSDVCLIVGHKADEVKKVVGDGVCYCLQKEQLGTGHAVIQALDFIGDEGEVFVLCGDTPLISKQSLEKLQQIHRTNGEAVTILSSIVDNPTGYGRIVRDEYGQFSAIVEQKDATQEQQAIQEINGGIYLFEASDLKYSLGKLTNNNAQNEYYLTDTIEILRNEGKKIGAVDVDEKDILGVNSRTQLAEATHIKKERINNFHMENGVTIIDPASTYIGPLVQIENDVIIEPNCFIDGKTIIKTGCIIGANSKLKNSSILTGAEVLNSVILDSEVGERTHVGPFAYLRPNSKVGNDVKVGDFVEIKNSNIGDNTKISHLTYIGDADVGENVNFGCGTVVVNYDGKNKHRTTIKDNAFIGCNTNLVSPVTVEKNAYTGAGSTITKDVPQDSLGIARATQRNIEQWVTKRD